jgi:mono/diheme cytochrome c family protein
MVIWRRGSLAILAAAVLLVACGDDPQPQAQGSEGAQLFAANCSMCHGEGAGGTEQGPPLVDEIYEPSHHSDDSFRSAVAQGVAPHHWEFGPMPAIPSLAEDDVNAIIEYVRGLQREAGID